MAYEDGRLGFSASTRQRAISSWLSHVAFHVLLVGIWPIAAAAQSPVVRTFDLSPAYAVVLEFNGYDGISPRAPLTQINGELFGTTEGGGGEYSDGTLYRIRDGKGSLALSFSDFGSSPDSALTYLDGAYYGTAAGGGQYQKGTVFSLKSGIASIVHSFGGSSANDGAGPANLINADGVLYGTTVIGGEYNLGTVFAITNGVESVVHSFGAPGDGEGPQDYTTSMSSLIRVDGKLYGTTPAGGAYGNGTIYSIDIASGAESVIYSFGQTAETGLQPAGVTAVGGVLYGTTYSGGQFNWGTIFSFEGGEETVLYSFANYPDGANPLSGLIEVNGTLYGTTAGGGANSFGNPYGYGTVFSFADGIETILHSFADDGIDGIQPSAALINVAGTLYGTTLIGGSEGIRLGGFGIVFSIVL